MTGKATHRRVLSKAAALWGLAALLAVAGPQRAEAADFTFPAESFGELLLVPNQSTGGNNALLQAQKGGAFEPISEFNIEDRYRTFSKPVARLDMLKQRPDGRKFVGTCTANLIAPGILLTNYHCIPGKDAQIKTLKSLAVFGYLREDQTKGRRYKVDVRPLAANRKMDFALLRVHGRPSKHFGTFKLKLKKARPNQSLFIIHHPAGMPKRLTRFRCKAYAPSPYAGIRFRHRCDTLGGSSGSLIFNLDFEAVALHHSGGLTEGSRTSFNSGSSLHGLMQNRQFAALIEGAANRISDAGRSGGSAPPQAPAPMAPAPMASAPMAPTPAPPIATAPPPEPAPIAPRPVRAAPRHAAAPLRAGIPCDHTRDGRVCASSMLRPQGRGKYDYRMRNLIRNDGMAWVENVSGYGEGQWVLFDFGAERKISRIVFRNGYGRTGKTFSSNSRVARALIETSTGARYPIRLNDHSRRQVYTLKQPLTATWIRLTIRSVYQGRKYSDTALSYMGFE